MTNILTSDAKIIQIYEEGKWSTVIENNILYLLITTKISDYNIIASISITNECKIYNRDLVNLFIDSIFDNFKKSQSTNNLSEKSIINLLLSCLRQDIGNLLSFTNDYNLIETIISKYPKNLQQNIIKAMKTLGLSRDIKIPYKRAYTEHQMIDLYDQKLYYACFDIKRKRYELTNNNDFSKTFKNYSCGSWKSLEEAEESYVLFFKKSDVNLIQDKNLSDIINYDLKRNPYETANRFLTFEARITKALDTIIDEIISLQGSCDLSLAYYPNIELFAEEIVKEIRKAQESKGLDIENLKTTYQNISQELQKAQNSLKVLYAIKEKGDK